MKIRNPRLIRLAADIAGCWLRLWMLTVRYRIINHDSAEHPADADTGRFIYTFWHEALLAPAKFRVRASILISRHADGELIARVAQRLGYATVRGSTTRGGGEALVSMWDCGKNSHLVFHPDGPRGPRRRAQIGAVMIASRSGIPIVPVGVGFSRCWRAGSWDRCAVPKMFSRCIFVAGESIHVPSDCDRASLEHYRALLETRMLAATAEAERIAAGGREDSESGSEHRTAASGPHFGKRAATESSQPRN